MSKRMKKNKQDMQSNHMYSIVECSKILKEKANAKFDETIEISMNLDVDPKHADQIVRGTVNLPHGTGKKLKIVAFVKEERIKEATDAGADLVGSSDLASKIEGGFTDFDRVVATPDMMAVVGKLGKVLGPRGLMPNPKLGTVTNDITKIIKDIKAGQVEFRAEKAGIVHAGVGKASFNLNQIEENIKHFIDAVVKAKPSGAKGTYVKNIYVSSSMGPSMKIAN